MTNPRVAVVIPAYNAAKTLPNCLQALISQIKRPDEIVVVDDGSTDGTYDIATGVPGVRCVRQENAGPATARNRGLRATSAEIIFFTDSDCVPADDWIVKTLPGFEREGVAVVAGSYDISNPQSRLARCIHAEILFRHERLMPEYPRAFGSYNFAISRAVFEEVGGFEESYRSASGEDNDLSYKVVQAAYKIYFERQSKVGHLHPERVSKYLSEQFRHGYWRVKMYCEHPHMSGGDDYTFWKDIVEIALVCGVFGAAFWGLLGWTVLITLGGGLAAVLLGLQVWMSFQICRGLFDRIFFSGVLFARAFSRMLGFSSGMIHIFRISRAKKKENNLVP